MVKLWLVTLSNGEQWHIFGEKNDILSMDVEIETIEFVRAYRG